MIGCFTDHVAPVLTVEFDPVGEFLVSSFTGIFNIVSHSQTTFFCGKEK